MAQIHSIRVTTGPMTSFEIDTGSPQRDARGVDNGHASNVENGPSNNVEHPTTYWDTMLHICRGNIGSGLFAMGDAFKNGGLIFAPLMTALLGIICVHAQHILLNCSDKMHRLNMNQPAPGYADTVYLVFANGPVRLRPAAFAMRILVDVFLCITQLGFCCVYIVFVSTNLQMIFWNIDISVETSLITIVVIVPIALLCLIRNLKYLAPISTLANLLMLVSVMYVIYAACSGNPFQQVGSRRYIGSWERLPLYFSTAIYAFEGIGLVLPLKNEMERPQLFQTPLGVLNVAMAFVGVLFITVGSLGYIKWGEETEGSLTLNLPPGELMTTVVQTLIALALLFTYPLQFYVPVSIMWPFFHRNFADHNPVLKELCFRTSLVLISFVIAISLPKLGLFISLVGAISSSILALIFPAVIELIDCSQEKKGLSWFTIIKDTFLLALGMFIFVAGTHQSIVAIIYAFINDNKVVNKIN